MGDRLLTVLRRLYSHACARFPPFGHGTVLSDRASQTPTPKGSRVSAAKVRHRTLEEFMNEFNKGEGGRRGQLSIE